ncbi:hypothetical protein [Streptomyces sp. D54]|uniref:hypothetical protein n=1 Tax=Streptomyces sp. D54 TaxID=1290289 RepID=UPI003CF5E79F
MTGPERGSWPHTLVEASPAVAVFVAVLLRLALTLAPAASAVALPVTCTAFAVLHNRLRVPRTAPRSAQDAADSIARHVCSPPAPRPE